MSGSHNNADHVHWYNMRTRQRHPSSSVTGADARALFCQRARTTGLGAWPVRGAAGVTGQSRTWKQGPFLNPRCGQRPLHSSGHAESTQQLIGDDWSFPEAPTIMYSRLCGNTHFCFEGENRGIANRPRSSRVTG